MTRLGTLDGRTAAGLAAAVWLAVFLPPALAQEVTLPLERYDELRQLAAPAPAPEPEPLAFEAAELAVAVSETSARITQDLVLAVYGDGWRSAALGETGTFVETDFGAAEGRLTERSVELRGVGRHRLRLISVLPLARDETAARPTWRLRLRAPAAALVRGTVEAPAEIEEIEAEGAIVAPDPGAGGRWRFVAKPGAEVSLTLFAAAAVPERASLPLVFESTSAVALEVAHSRRRARAWIEVRVRQGRLEELAVEIPPGLEVIGVGGDPIAGWDVEVGRLVVTPLAAVTGALGLEVELAGGAADELICPTLVPEGAAAALAATKVRLSGDGLLQLVDPGAGRRPDDRQLAELPAAFRSAAGRLLVLPGGGPPPRWQVTWPESAEVLAAQVDRLLVDVVVGETGRAFYQLWAEVRNRGAARLTLGLPDGAELAAARRDGRPVVPGRSAGGWAVPLRSAGEAQVIYLASVLPLPLPAAGGELELPLPRLSAPAARLEVRLALPGGRRYALTDVSRRGAAGRPPVMRHAPGSPGALAQALGAAPGLEAMIGGELFPQPPGFQLVEAAWTALATAPAPLRLRVTDDADKRRWF